MLHYPKSYCVLNIIDAFAGNMWNEDETAAIYGNDIYSNAIYCI